MLACKRYRCLPKKAWTRYLIEALRIPAVPLATTNEMARLARPNFLVCQALRSIEVNLIIDHDVGFSKRWGCNRCSLASG